MKIHKEKTIKKIILVLLIMILGSTLIELGTNIKSLYMKNQNIMKIDEDHIELKGFVKKGKGYYLSNAEGVLRCDLNNKYVKKFVYDFDTGDMVDAEIKVGYDNSMGKEEVMIIEDKNPILLSESVVNVNKKVKWIEISLSSVEGGSGIYIKNIRINNQIEINKYRIFCSSVLILGICVCVIFRKKITKEIEYGFGIIALTLGIIFVISIPTNKVGWDEETHFKRAYQMSIYPGGEKISTEISGQFTTDILYNYPYFQPQSYEEKQNLNGIINNYYKNGDHAVTVKGELCGVYTVGLVPQAIAIKIVRCIGMPFTYIFLAGRFAELMTYIIVMFFAIRIIPIGKRALTFISLTPTALFLAVTYTYDTIVFCFISLAIAMIMREWLKEKDRVNTKKIFIANLFMIIGCLPKAVYAPVALIEMLIPRERYENKKKRNQVVIIAGIVFLILMSTFIIPQLLNPNAMEDTRGTNVDSGQQMSLILAKPFAYAGIVLKNIWNTFPNFAFAESCYRLMGHLAPGGFQYLIPIIAVLLVSTDYSAKLNKKIKWTQKVGILVLLGMSVVLIWTALYIAFSEPGSSSIGGVQGRYYRPLLWLLYLVCSNNLIQVRVSDRRYNQFVLGMSVLISGITVYNVFGTFCI